MNLLDLPNELLLSVISDYKILSLADIYNVSLLSRRLNALAIPVYLATHGIAAPEREVPLYVTEWNPDYMTTTRQPDALSGLNVSIGISRVHHLKCYFQDPNATSTRNTFQRASNLPYAVERTTHFIRRLEHLDKAEIYLVWDPYFVIRNKTVTHVPVSELNEWTSSFSTLLNLIVERGCKSLTVQYDSSIEPAFHFRSSGRLKRVVTYISHNILRRSTPFADIQWKFERPLHEESNGALDVRTVNLSNLAQGANTILSLSLHSNALLLPPLIGWTTSLLRTHKCLTCITFAHISFSKNIWKTILPVIADAISDRLKELSFFRHCPNLDISDLLPFLARFPNLTHLCVDRTFRLRLQHTTRPKRLPLYAAIMDSQSIPNFPQLQSLQAPTELVHILLNVRLPVSNRANAQVALPNLNSLTVYPSSQLLHPTSYLRSTRSVNFLHDQVAARPRAQDVAFSLDVQMEFTDFARVARYLQSVSQETGVDRDLWGTLNFAQAEQKPRQHFAFVRVARLILYKFNPCYSDQTPASLCLWLKLLFPNLRQLTFTYSLSASPEYVREVDMDPDTKAWLIRELEAACPKVRTLVIAGKEYRLW
ncbi:hypothetical protein B0H34DRAFT_129122 [Crassisporium funariophilum]|nr:hypothetical protein B0H34DRAFT_129122 [Crassisporium funariophilum]